MFEDLKLLILDRYEEFGAGGVVVTLFGKLKICLLFNLRRSHHRLRQLLPFEESEELRRLSILKLDIVLHGGSPFGDLSHFLKLLYYLFEVIIIIFSISSDPKEYSEFVGGLINEYSLVD